MRKLTGKNFCTIEKKIKNVIVVFLYSKSLSIRYIYTELLLKNKTTQVIDKDNM